MKENIQNLINGFLERAGSYVFLAIVIARLSSLAVHFAVLYLIAKITLGEVIYAFSFVTLLLPLAGLGVQQSLVRYGALLKIKEEKEALFIYALKKGILISIILIVALLVVSEYYPFKFVKSLLYFRLLVVTILTQFLFAIIQIYFRLQHNNKQYAILEISYALLFLVLTVVLSYLFKENGYIIAIVVTPLLIFTWFFKQLNVNFKNTIILKITDFSFWKYGFFAGLSYVTTLLLLEIDIILVGNLLADANKVRLYRYITLIPFSLLFLPRVLLTTDFVNLTEKINDKTYINNYIKSYFTVFFSVSCVVLLFSILFSKSILNLFGEEFTAYSTTFITLIIGVISILMIRGLFGNLLSSIGKANVNFNIAVVAIIINIISNYYFIPKYGILGAAITSAIIMWITSLITLFSFYYFYKHLLLTK